MAKSFIKVRSHLISIFSWTVGSRLATTEPFCCDRSRSSCVLRILEPSKIKFKIKIYDSILGQKGPFFSDIRLGQSSRDERLGKSLIFFTSTRFKRKEFNKAKSSERIQRLNLIELFKGLILTDFNLPSFPLLHSLEGQHFLPLKSSLFD